MKLKIGVIGPTEAGKTSLVNLLGSSGANLAEGTTSGNTYRPTNSVRIVEVSIPNVNVRNFNIEAEIQLWEIGGNPKLKSIWPAVQRDLDGVIIVYNVHNESHIKDSSALHMHFVTHSPDGMSHCFIVGNVFKGMRDIGPQRILGVQKRTRHFAANIEDDAKTKVIMDEFMQFVSTVAQTVYEREKQNLEGFKHGHGAKSKKLTAADLHKENEAEAEAVGKRPSASRRPSISTAAAAAKTSRAPHRSWSKQLEQNRKQEMIYFDDGQAIDAIKSALTASASARHHKSRR